MIAATCRRRWVVLLVVFVSLPYSDSFSSFGPILKSSSVGIGTRHSPLKVQKDDSILVVVSPPGGIGEVTAVKAATMGAMVKWLVVSPPPLDDRTSGDVVAPSLSNQLVLSQRAMDEIAAAGGTVEIARSDALSVLLPKDDPNSALSAVEAWCQNAGRLVCTDDTADATKRKKQNREEEDRQVTWKNAIKVAAKQAAKSMDGIRLAVLSSEDEIVKAGESSDSPSDPLKRVVDSLLGTGKVEIPNSMVDALESGGDGGTNLFLRYGQLFGIPESSPDFSPLVGGPKKSPEFCEEYMMRSVRIDPTYSVSGNLMLSKDTTRSSRLAVGEAAALMVLENVDIQPGLDVSLSSLRGKEPVPRTFWNDEFTRVLSLLASGQGSQLFSAEFGIVNNLPRFADWLATKWAPTVLRTFEIASIRVGGRPVYVTQPNSETVEIIWQQLVNFESAVVGKMTIEVTENSLVAWRGAGDLSKGFGDVSRTPLPGEDVLVRRLAEAASQAIEKGLATKVGFSKFLEELRRLSIIDFARIFLPNARLFVLFVLVDSGIRSCFRFDSIGYV